jgi:hypothetical protein
MDAENLPKNRGPILSFPSVYHDDEESYHFVDLQTKKLSCFFILH